METIGTMQVRPREFFGRKLYFIRNFWGLSLQDLAEKLAVSRQYLHRIETGFDEPSPTLFVQMLDVLKVEEEFFFSLPDGELVEECFHFRSLRKTKEHFKAQIKAYSFMLNNLIKEFENFLILPKVILPDCKVPNPDYLLREDIEDAAEQCRIHWKLGITAPISNMARLLEASGCFLLNLESHKDLDAFSIHARRPIIIRNTAKQSLSRERFDLAHEYGHLILHQGILTGDPHTEEQANYFASAFLLPRSAFYDEFSFLRKAGPISWAKLIEKKYRWKVSISAILRRAFNLNMISPDFYRIAQIQMSKKGWKTKEPGDEEMPLEEPSLLQKSIRQLLEHKPEHLVRCMKRISFKAEAFLQLINRAISADELKKTIEQQKRKTSENLIVVDFKTQQII